MTRSAKPLSLSIAVIAVATVFMVDSTWMSWPDAIYDFGSQLYYPWQMLAGRHLYTDIAYFNGPLSQYFNAGMFAIFGVGLRTLIWVNFAIVLGVLGLIFHLIRRLSDLFTATCGCLVFVMVFAFSQYVGIGNYNWICPYTHEVTHGVALSLAMIAAMGAFMRTNHRRWIIISGALLGLVFLTKAEVFVPALGAAGLGLVLSGRKIGNAGLPWFAASFGGVILIAFATIAMTINPPTALRAIRGSWPWVFDRRIAQLQFYRQGLGIDDLPGNLWKMATIGLASGLIVLTVMAAALLPKKWRAVAALGLGAELIGMFLNWRLVLQIGRPWPVFVAVIAALSIKRAWAGQGDDRRQWSLRAMLSLLALGLLGKMLLNARIWQYGFALAMPAAVILVEAIVGWIPVAITSGGGSGKLARRAGVVTLISATICIASNQYRGRQNSVGSGADQFLPCGRGEEVNRAARTIQYLIPQRGTLAVMPQGLMLNYLTRREDSVACVNLMPPEVLSVGEDQVVEKLNGQPPDVIVLSEKDVESGAFILSEGDYHYGGKIIAWVLNHYHRVIPPDQNSELKLSYWTRSINPG